MSEALAKLQGFALKQKKIQADAELTLHKVVTAKGHRAMKCPACGGRAISSDPELPYICECGWRSDKMNGKSR